MRTVTIKELNALSAAISDVRAVLAEIGGMTAAGPAIMEVNAPEDALRFGIKLTGAALAAKERVMLNFERAAYNFLGERRKDGESLAEYQTRICAMTESELLAAPARNGLRLKL